MAIAASATPSCEPMPPSTTMASTSADSWKVKDSGLMKPCRVAKNAPAKPPNIAPVANAVSLVVVVLMPSARQATSSSGSPSQEAAQADRDPVGQKRERQDHVEQKYDAMGRREFDAEFCGETVIAWRQRNPE